jgi:hypothetical protein
MVIWTRWIGWAGYAVYLREKKYVKLLVKKKLEGN